MIELAGRILTEDNRSLLKIIYRYGGYVRAKHLAFLYPEILGKSRIKKLDKLAEMKYLTKRRFKTDSKIEPVTYQVTQKTCKLFNNPDSYFRKKHNEEYAYRALLKSYFCCEIHNKLGDHIIADHDDRTELFVSGGFKEETFPRKYNKDSSFIHLEELVLDLTKKENTVLAKDEIIYDDTEARAVIIYIDKYYIAIKHQLTQLINKYINMILSGDAFRVDFLIVVDDKERGDIYKKEAEKFTSIYTHKQNKYSDGNILDITLKYYKDFLLSYYEKKEDEIKKKSIEEYYESGVFKREILARYREGKSNTLTENDRKMLSGIKNMEAKYIEEGMKMAFKRAGGFSKIDTVKAEMDSYFDKIFSLIIGNFAVREEAKIVKKFDIKVYQVSEKIYI